MLGKLTPPFTFLAIIYLSYSQCQLCEEERVKGEPLLFGNTATQDKVLFSSTMVPSPSHLVAKGRT